MTQNSLRQYEQDQLNDTFSGFASETSLEYPTIVHQDLWDTHYKGLCGILQDFLIEWDNQAYNQLTFAPNSECVLKAGKKLTIGASPLFTDATLRLQAGASVELIPRGILTLDNTAVFGGKIKVGANAKLIIKRGTKFDNTIIDVANGGVVEVVDSPVIAANSSITVGDLSSIQILPNSCLNISGTANFNAGSSLYGTSNTTSKVAVTGTLKVNGTSTKG